MIASTFAARIAGTLLLGAGAACGLVVTDTVPGFSCLPGADSCPEGQTCEVATHTCVAASADGGTLPDAPPGEGGLPPPGGCSHLGCKCAGASDCASGICGDQSTVPAAIYAAAASVNFCTRPCCTSADCDESTVCFGSGEGNRYCVLPAWLGRSSTLGSGQGGASCGADSDCRSGLCAASACADVCCSTAQAASQCAAGSTCRFGVFPGRAFDTRYTALCGVGTDGSGETGASCTADADCRSGLCAPDKACHDACRNSSDCGTPTLECGYALPNFNTSAFITACSKALGTGAMGARCQGNGGCQSGFCDATSMQCTDVCYADSDCTLSGWRCRPEAVILFNHSYSLLACGT